MADLPEGYSIRQAPPAAPQGLPEGYSVRQPAAPPEAAPAGPLSWSDVPGQALENLGSSAVKFGKDIIRPLTEPVETAKSLGKVLLGTVQKVIPGEQDSEKYADAVGKFFSDRYGGLENVKKTMADDPVGFLADVSAVLSLGGTAVAQAPGKVGQVGSIVQKAGRAVDPLVIAATPAKLAAKGAGKVAAGTLGLTTGTSGKSVGTAARAGLEGGDAARAFRENLRGGAAADDVVADAHRAVGDMHQAKIAAYQADMAKLAKDPAMLDFGPIDDAVRDVGKIGQFKGKVLNPPAEGVWKEIADAVDDWRMSDPAEFHTPIGLDALKQKIGNIRDGTQYGTPARRMADQVYHAVKDQIVKQAPEYGKTMKDYEAASGHIRELEKALSLGKGAATDTALRKLQKTMRNNASTNYDNLRGSIKMLEDAGAANLTEKLAGQMLSSGTPRGLARAGGYMTPGALAAAGGAYTGNPLIAALGGASLLASSPRLVGEGAYLEEAPRARRPSWRKCWRRAGLRPEASARPHSKPAVFRQ